MFIFMIYVAKSGGEDVVRAFLGMLGLGRWGLR